jgi:hypothetical protein
MQGSFTAYEQFACTVCDNSAVQLRMYEFTHCICATRRRFRARPNCTAYAPAKEKLTCSQVSPPGVWAPYPALVLPGVWAPPSGCHGNERICCRNATQRPDPGHKPPTGPVCRSLLPSQAQPGPASRTRPPPKQDFRKRSLLTPGRRDIEPPSTTRFTRSCGFGPF